MEIKLTKEADKLLAVMYSAYRARRKEGQGKSTARHFDGMYLASLPPCCDWPEEDFSGAMHELSRSGLVVENIIGDCDLSEKAVSILEDRVTDGLVDAASFVAQFIP